eukprot:gene7568-11892_t
MLTFTKKFVTVPQKRLFFTQKFLFQESIEDTQKFFQTKQVHNIPQNELKSLISEEFKKIVVEVTKEDGYEPEEPLKFVIADRSLKYRVLTKAMKFFQREIPSYELAPIETAKGAAEWFYNKIISERPHAPLDVPENVTLFIKQYKNKAERKKQEEKAKKQHEQHLRNKLKTTKKYYEE